MQSANRPAQPATTAAGPWVYDAARAAQETGVEIPEHATGRLECHRLPARLGADWRSATAGRWTNPYSLTRVADDGDFEL